MRERGRALVRGVRGCRGEKEVWCKARREVVGELFKNVNVECVAKKGMVSCFL